VRITRCLFVLEEEGTQGAGGGGGALLGVLNIIINNKAQRARFCSYCGIMLMMRMMMIRWA
jgi:hypothetical protein